MSGLKEAMAYSVLEKSLGFKPKAIFTIMEAYSHNAQNALEAVLSSKSLKDEYGLTQQILESSRTDVERKVTTLESNTYFVVKGTEHYPNHLALIKRPPHVIYVQGNLAALQKPGISIVGSRKASLEGQMRASRLARLVGEQGFPVISGLALGIDTAAHKGALHLGFQTTAVIGTPINQAYPKENEELQKAISQKGTLLSQFSPVSTVQRLNFPMRNEVMSGLSLATVIVEAGETSGALLQAKYALSQGRRLYIMKNQLEKPGLEWPKKYVSLGAKVLENVEDLISDVKELHLESERSVKVNPQLSLI